MFDPLKRVTAKQRAAFAQALVDGVPPGEAAMDLGLTIKTHGAEEEKALNDVMAKKKASDERLFSSWLTPLVSQSEIDAAEGAFRKAQEEQTGQAERLGRQSVVKAVDRAIERRQQAAAAQRAIDDQAAQVQADAEEKRKVAIIEERKKAQERLNQEAETRRQAKVKESAARTATALKILQMAQPAAGQTTTNVPAAVVQQAGNVLTNILRPDTSTGGVAPEGFRYQRGGKTYVKRNGVFVVEQ